MAKRNPFGLLKQVKFRHCDDPDCRCLLLTDGITGTTIKKVGKTVIVRFGDRYEGLMEWETGFRLETIEKHLEKAP